MQNLDGMSQQLALCAYLCKPLFTLGTKLPQTVEPLTLAGNIGSTTRRYRRDDLVRRVITNGRPGRFRRNLFARFSRFFFAHVITNRTPNRAAARRRNSNRRAVSTD
jgi:hypothetical protein